MINTVAADMAGTVVTLDNSTAPEAVDNSSGVVAASFQGKAELVAVSDQVKPQLAPLEHLGPVI